MLIICIQVLGAEYFVYYDSLIPIYRSLYEIEPFFEYTHVVKIQYERPRTEIVKIREGHQPTILIHGIDPWEIKGVWTIYKKAFIESWKRLLPAEYGLYIFIYPSLDVPLEQIAEKLVEEILKFDEKVNIYAHSMGGLIVRYMLCNKEVRSQIGKIIFAATPHIGSPFADFIITDKKLAKLHPKWNLIKSMLISANLTGSFIEAPNYSYLIFGKTHPEIPSGIEFINFAGSVPNSLIESFRNSVETNFLTTQGLNLLAIISKLLYDPDSDFVQNDGMVPLKSATYFGNAVVFDGYDHADFILSDIIINEAIKYLYFSQSTTVFEGLGRKGASVNR